MKMTHMGLGMLVAGCLACSSVLAQQSTNQPLFPVPSPTEEHRTRPTSPATAVSSSSGLSDWITYQQREPDGLPNRYTPLYTESYLRAGPSIPVGGMTLSRELQTGWSVVGGVRALFFNVPHTRAWVADLHIINTHEYHNGNATGFPVTVFSNNTRTDFGSGGLAGATVNSSNRTMVGLGFGRQWYLREPANVAEGKRWRVGLDGGGRYGTHRLDLNEARHLVDVIGAMHLAVSSDIEIPWRSVVLTAGARFEWAYTWSDVLQQTSDVQDLNVLFTAGVRY
ncbi:MAG: hypothetical protein EXS16_04645 [Gemmataceae bacterium]|nr:hypothetical protein [Gemmataceae bacterium]